MLTLVLMCVMPVLVFFSWEFASETIRERASCERVNTIRSNQSFLLKQLRKEDVKGVNWRIKAVQQVDCADKYKFFGVFK